MNRILFREIAVAAFLFLVARLAVRSFFQKRQRKLPPGPKGWPVIGALPLLGTMPHAALAKMAKKYGPVMYLKMGTCDMVVASTPDAARAFLKTLDINFSNRPPNAGATHLAYNAQVAMNPDPNRIYPRNMSCSVIISRFYEPLRGMQDMVFAGYGPRWKLLRKLSNLHLLGGKALEDWARVREEEVGHMLRAMCEASDRAEAVVVSEMLTYAMANMIGQVKYREHV